MISFKLPRQSQYPRKIYYTNECYKVIFKKKLDCYGITDPQTKTITIKDGLSARQLLSTFIHELAHVVEFERPLKIKHKDVYKLETAIVELLLDNFL